MHATAVLAASCREKTSACVHRQQIRSHVFLIKHKELSRQSRNKILTRATGDKIDCLRKWGGAPVVSCSRLETSAKNVVVVLLHIPSEALIGIRTAELPHVARLERLGTSTTQTKYISRRVVHAHGRTGSYERHSKPTQGPKEYIAELKNV